MNKLILLDFDGTITTKDTFPLFVKFDKGNIVFCTTFLWFSPLIVLYKLGFYEGGKIKQKILSALYKGCSERELSEKGYAFVDFLFDKGIIKPEFIRLIEDAGKTETNVVVVSASPDMWIKPFADKYNIVYLCTELEYNGGRFSGRFSSKNCVGFEKVNRIKNRFNLKDYTEIVAYGNSKDDEQMFRIAGKFYKV
ncbi:MAG: HAD family hydrolase [Sediminibacterium sp.]|nr:HAD family hydrolase [Sediminibacterium sp.]